MSALTAAETLLLQYAQRTAAAPIEEAARAILANHPHGSTIDLTTMTITVPAVIDAPAPPPAPLDLTDVVPPVAP